MRRNGSGVLGVEALELELHYAVVKLAHKLLELGRLELLPSVGAKEHGEQAGRVYLVGVAGSGGALDERRGSPDKRQFGESKREAWAHLSTFMTRLNSC